MSCACTCFWRLRQAYWILTAAESCSRAEWACGPGALEGEQPSSEATSESNCAERCVRESLRMCAVLLCVYCVCARVLCVCCVCARGGLRTSISDPDTEVRLMEEISSSLMLPPWESADDPEDRSVLNGRLGSVLGVVDWGSVESGGW